ncbi:MAG: InlB B-repeat-containing protein, partial [Lachnospiraceae bacterium]
GQMADQTINVGESTALTANAFTRSGYTFTGWNTAADGSGTSYADGAEVTDLALADGSVTLYAQWKQNVYTVHFDANGGSGDMSDQKITVGESTALTANAFTRSGYTFTGWNTAADGSGTSYADGTEVTDLAQADGSVTLYAQWKQNTTPAPVYKIIKGDGQTWTKGTSTGISMTADGPFAKFEKLLIDGSEVAQSDYSAASGSTVVTTTAAYAESLALGQHTLTVQYTDGSATGTFYVAEKQTDTTEKPADSEDNTEQPAADKADALLQIAAKKILAGGTLADGQFSFELRDADGQTLQTAKNGSDGLVMFDRLSFASEGTYTYTVREVLPEDADPSLDGIQKDGVTYDETVYTVTVTVARNADTGKLEASALCRAEGSSENTEMVFTNTAVPASDVETVAGDDSVDTGDSLRAVLYAAVMIACLALIILMVSRRHRESKEQ